MSKDEQGQQDFIAIDQYLNGNPQTKMNKIQFYAYGGNNAEKSVLVIGEGYISYSQYRGERSIGPPSILNSKDCLVYADRENKKISIKQIGQEKPILTFAYTANEAECDTGYNSKIDNPDRDDLPQHHPHIEEGGEGGTPGMKEK